MSKWEAALKLTGVGFFIGGVIVLGVFIGIWLDGKFGTKFFWIIGLAVGLGMAFLGVFRMLVPLINQQDREKD